MSDPSRRAVGRWVAVAEHDAGVTWPEVRGVIRSTSATAGRDADVPGIPLSAGASRFGRDGTQGGIPGGRRLATAGRHHVAPLAVIVFLGVDAADDHQVMHLLGDVRQQLRNVHARDRRGIVRKGPPVSVLGSGVPSLPTG